MKASELNDNLPDPTEPHDDEKGAYEVVIETLSGREYTTVRKVEYDHTEKRCIIHVSE